MANTNITAVDSSSTTRQFVTQTNADGSLTFYRVEDPVQRTALLSKFDTLTTTAANTTTVIGPINDAIAASDTAPSSVAGRLQYISTNITATLAATNRTIGVQAPANSVSITPATGATFPVTGPLTDTLLRATPVPVSGTVAVTGALTDALLRASPVPVSGTIGVTGPLTDTLLRASPVPVSGTVGVSGTIPVTGPLTDSLLRATPVPISGAVAVSGTVGVSGTIPVTGPLTDTLLRATPVPVSGTVAVTGPLTDTLLRASPVPVSGTLAVTGPLTDTLLRATPVAVTVSGVATEATVLRAAVALESTPGGIPAGANTIGAVLQAGLWNVGIKSPAPDTVTTATTIDPTIVNTTVLATPNGNGTVRFKIGTTGTAFTGGTVVVFERIKIPNATALLAAVFNSNGTRVRSTAVGGEFTFGFEGDAAVQIRIQTVGTGAALPVLVQIAAQPTYQFVTPTNTGQTIRSYDRTGKQRLVTSGVDVVSAPINASEVLLHARGGAMFIDINTAAISTTAPLCIEAGEKFHMQIIVGDIVHAIQDTVAGTLLITPVG